MGVEGACAPIRVGMLGSKNAINSLGNIEMMHWMSCVLFTVCLILIHLCIKHFLKCCSHQALMRHSFTWQVHMVSVIHCPCPARAIVPGKRTPDYYRSLNSQRPHPMDTRHSSRLNLCTVRKSALKSLPRVSVLFCSRTLPVTQTSDTLLPVLMNASA